MTNIEAERELSPCPFCGSRDVKLAAHPGAGRGVEHRGETVYSIDCMSCAASVPNRYREDVIVTAWNRRTPVIKESFTTEREAFEAELRKRWPNISLNTLQRQPKKYALEQVDFAWVLWQARASQPSAASIAEPVTRFIDRPFAIVTDRPVWSLLGRNDGSCG